MKTTIPDPTWLEHKGFIYDPLEFETGANLGRYDKLFDSDQLRAAMAAAYNEAIEDAAKVCDEQAAYERADKCTEQIRKLKE